jgi:hypothetical protein
MKFNADGFGPPPDCNPETPPTFSLKDTSASPSSGGSGGAGIDGKVEVKAKVKVEAK